MHIRLKTILIFSLFWAVLVAGCGPMAIAYSPQQAAINAATDSSNRSGAVVDLNSIQARQALETLGRTFVLVSYEQQVEGRQEKCLMMYEVRKSSLGTWIPASGGGGCGGQISGEPQPDPPLSMGGNSSSGSANDPGYSAVHGLVSQDNITRVRVTWVDKKTTEADVINGCYISVRAGLVRFSGVEGLDSGGAVVFGNQIDIAPGKQ